MLSGTEVSDASRLFLEVFRLDRCVLLTTWKIDVKVKRLMAGSFSSGRIDIQFGFRCKIQKRTLLCQVLVEKHQTIIHNDVTYF